MSDGATTVEERLRRLEALVEDGEQAAQALRSVIGMMVSAKGEWRAVDLERAGVPRSFIPGPMAHLRKP
jgi:hypothetical protein